MSAFPMEKVVEQTVKAVKALQAHHAKKENNNTEESIFLVIAVNKIAEKASVKPVRLTVPHPWKDVSSSASCSVCLITKDDPEVKGRVAALEIPAITKVTGVGKLAGKTKPFEAKRALCAEYDLFLADERVLPLLPKILGKTFFDKKKLPVAVDLDGKRGKKDLRVELCDAIQATYLHLNTGPCTVIRVGQTGQSAEQVTGNVKAVVEQLEKKLPGGFGNIRSVQLKTSTSIALPLME